MVVVQSSKFGFQRMLENTSEARRLDEDAQKRGSEECL